MNRNRSFELHGGLPGNKKSGRAQLGIQVDSTATICRIQTANSPGSALVQARTKICEPLVKRLRLGNGVLQFDRFSFGT